jgi:hypothetical protein
MAAARRYWPPSVTTASADGTRKAAVACIVIGRPVGYDRRMADKRVKYIIAGGTVVLLSVTATVSVVAKDLVFESYVENFLALSNTVLSCF